MITVKLVPMELVTVTGPIAERDRAREYLKTLKWSVVTKKITSTGPDEPNFELIAIRTPEDAVENTVVKEM